MSNQPNADDVLAELETLRAEVAELRAWRDRHVCGGGGGGNSTVWYTQPNMCGGAAGGAGGAYTYTVPWTNTTGAAGPTVTFGPQSYNTGCAGAIPPMIFDNGVGGECA